MKQHVIGSVYVFINLRNILSIYQADLSYQDIEEVTNSWSQPCSVAPRELKYISVELKDWHPATGRNLYGADDPNVGPINAILPNNPAIIIRLTGLRVIGRQTLS